MCAGTPERRVIEHLLPEERTALRWGGFIYHH